MKLNSHSFPIRAILLRALEAHRQAKQDAPAPAELEVYLRQDRPREERLGDLLAHVQLGIKAMSVASSMESRHGTEPSAAGCRDRAARFVGPWCELLDEPFPDLSGTSTPAGALEALQAMRGVLLRVLAPAFDFPDDYSTCHWGGQFFDFTPTQAACIRVMDDARKRGVPGLRQATILAEAGSKQADSPKARLRRVFLNNPAWGSLVVCRGKGIYGLADPPKS
jgi:hypothetical protein